MGDRTAAAVARELAEAGYERLFLAGDERSLDSAWRGGENRAALTEIVDEAAYAEVSRMLASEVLRAKGGDGNPASGPVYARALALSGLGGSGLVLPANVWGFMYHADEHGGDAYGQLGPRLLEAGETAVPTLSDLLDDTSRLLYVGSNDATLGNALRYRVKDAAAYYLGKIAGLPVPFHAESAERDVEIDRLRKALDGQA